MPFAHAPLFVSRLALASALTLFAVPAVLADDNFANIEQGGDDNAASATQGPGDDNDIGTAVLAARQNGNLNILTILQSGSDNSIGASGTGLQQNSNRSTATITQSSDGNSVGQVTQTGIASTTGGTSLPRNTLTILQQTGDGNSIGTVTQARSSAADSALGNSANLTQSGDDNVIGTLSQSGYAQLATLTQTGDDNDIDSVDQRGIGNSATISLTGDGNGVSAFAFPTDITGAWGSLVQGRVYQDNEAGGTGVIDGNILSFIVTGDDNSFGFSQTGTANQIDGLIGPLGSAGNQTGVIQLGSANLAGFTIVGSDNLVFIDQGGGVNNSDNDANVLILGDGNQVGVAQTGIDNSALVDIDDGDDNIVNIAQDSVLGGNLAEVTITGDANLVTLNQSGSNSAGIDLHGDDNLLVASQTGTTNSLTINLWGNGNNSTANGGFTGVALTTSLLTSPDLVPGSIVQNGSGNSILYDVGTALVGSDDNKFAFSQIGNDNRIEGSTVGSGNQVVIVQNGDLSFTSFSQNGIGNIIAVSQ